MTRRQMTIVLSMLLVLIFGGLAMAWQGQAEDSEKATGAIQYKLVQVPQVMTQAQLQTVLTTQGNAGYRLLMPYAVGTPPIPNQTVLIFSKP